MGFSKKIGNVKNVAKGGGGGSDTWIKFIPKEGRMKVRFLQEPEEWAGYLEVWDDTVNRGYPLPDGEQAPPDSRASQRYLVNAVDIENDKVIPLQMPKTLVKQLLSSYDIFGTMLDRDYFLMKQGSGTDTTYSAAADGPSKINMKKYAKSMHDLEAVLEAAYVAVNGALDDEDEEEAVRKPKPRRAKAADEAKPSGKPAPRRKAKPEPEEDEDEDWDEEEEEEEEEEAEDEEWDEDDDEEEEEEESDEDWDEDEDEEEEESDDDAWTPESLGALGIKALRDTAREYGIDPTGLKKDDIIEAIMNWDGEEDSF